MKSTGGAAAADPCSSLMVRSILSGPSQPNGPRHTTNGDYGSFFHRAAIFLPSSPGTQMTTTFAPAGPVLCRTLSGGLTYPLIPGLSSWLLPLTTCSYSPETT